ncbi:MAG: CBS domain-containing protein [Candidatus Zixiibacteriota bacterium]|nr:MAG: CBS domain-containing protein [candidate division Zixibacteria bacterium]
MAQLKSLMAGKRLTYVSPHMTVTEVARKMADARIGAVVVLEDEELKGIFTERDLLNRVVGMGKDPKVVKVSEVMTTDVCVCSAEDSYEHCLAQMRQIGCRHMPVVEESRLLGIISMRDLLKYQVSVKESELKMMDSLYRYQPPNMEI